MVTRRPHCYAGAQLVPGLPDGTPDAVDTETHYYSDKNTMSPETASTNARVSKARAPQPVSLPGVLVSDCTVEREYSYNLPRFSFRFLKTHRWHHQRPVYKIPLPELQI